MALTASEDANHVAAEIIANDHQSVRQWVNSDNAANWARAHRHLQQWAHLAEQTAIKIDEGRLTAAQTELQQRLGQRVTINATGPDTLERTTAAPIDVVIAAAERGQFKRFTLPNGWFFDRDAALPPGMRFDTPPTGARWSTSISGTPTLTGKFRLPAVNVEMMLPQDCWLVVSENRNENKNSTIPQPDANAHATVARPWQYRLPILPQDLDNVSVAEFPQVTVIPPGIIRMTPHRSGTFSIQITDKNTTTTVPFQVHQPTRLYGGEAIVARAGQLFRHHLHTGSRPGSRITRIAGLPAGLWHDNGTVGGGCTEVGRVSVQVYGEDSDGFRWQAPAIVHIKPTQPQADEIFLPPEQEDQQQQQESEQDQEQQNSEQNQQQDEQGQEQQQGEQGQEQQQGEQGQEQQQGEQGQEQQQGQQGQGQQQGQQGQGQQQVSQAQQQGEQNSDTDNGQETQAARPEQSSPRTNEQDQQDQQDQQENSDANDEQGENSLSENGEIDPDAAETEPSAHQDMANDTAATDDTAQEQTDGQESDDMTQTITDGRQNIDETADETIGSEDSDNEGVTTQVESSVDNSSQQNNQQSSDMQNIAADRWIQRLPSGNNPVLLRRLLPIEDPPAAKSGDDKGQTW